MVLHQVTRWVSPGLSVTLCQWEGVLGGCVVKGCCGCPPSATRKVGCAVHEGLCWSWYQGSWEVQLRPTALLLCKYLLQVQQTPTYKLSLAVSCVFLSLQLQLQLLRSGHLELGYL